MNAKLLHSVQQLGTGLSIDAGTLVDCFPATNLPDGKDKLYIRPEYPTGIWDDVSDDNSILVDKTELLIYPDCYLHVTECRSGEEWIVPIKGKMTLDLSTRVKQWIKNEYCGEFKLDGELTPLVDGDYYAKIMTDGRPPDSVVCWTSGGFYIKSTY